MNLLDSLKENNSVVLQQEANNWEEAIKVCMKPLLESNSIEEKYIENIIKKNKGVRSFLHFGSRIGNAT